MSSGARQVLLLADTRALERPLDYSVPDALGDVPPGTLVACPLGPRRLIGVVVGGGPPTYDGTLQPLAGVVDTPPVPPELMDLALWTARYYAAPVSPCVRLVLPPGAEGALRRGADGQWGLAAPPRGPAPRWVARVVPGAARPGGRRGDVWDALVAAGGALPAAELVRRASTTRETLRRMADDGRLVLTREAPGGGPDPHALGAVNAPADAPPPTDAQAAASASIAAALDDGTPAVLLHGVTGSGKTEVYLHAIERVRAAGRGAIVLVPEISLTPQLLGRLRARLGDRVALWHSAMTPAERARSYAALRDGEADVVVGARSAVYAPVRDVGLVIVDEEHDASYKQDSSPRYDARQVAYRRASQAGALVVYGSATPRPETWRSLPRLTLPARVDGSQPPPVRVVDMRTQAAGPVSRPLARALRDAAERDEKAILLLNRRGFALSALCAACGWIAECPNCDVALVHHRDPPRMVCHHCGHDEAVPPTCPACGAVDVLRAGVGTEGLEAAVARIVPDARRVRLDASSASGRGAVARLLDEFSRPGAAVLMGTQMVAKGHDLSDVTVAAIVDADAALTRADFRAEERTFDLIVQTAGRAGRRGEPATVIVQALEPDARAVRLAAEGAVGEFLDGEMERRERHGMPPFSHLVRLVADGYDRDATAAVAQALAKAITGFEGVDALGPAQMHRLRGRWRRSVTARADRAPRAVHAALEALEACRELRERGDVRVSVDVDPQ